MKPTRKLLAFLPALLVLLLACQVSGVAATPGAQQSASTYVSPENGITIHYPTGWTTQTSAQSDQALVTFLSSDQSIQSRLYVSPLQPGDTAESVTGQIAGSILQGATNVTVLSDAAIKRSDSVSGWSRVVTATSNGANLKLNFTTLINGPREFSLLTYADVSNYNANANAINALVSGISFQAPVVNGVNRNQALFLAGGESTNPRDYDPATERDSGDKRLYSGLVSLDANLRPAPDLAQSWDISSGGTVYTFHLRPNAKFQDGRSVLAQDVIYSWERAANPVTKSDTVLTYLGDILGVADMHSGKAQHISGLKALDDHTLQVTIDAAKPYFLFKLTLPVAFVLDQKNVESGSNWYRTPTGTGPYKLSRWDSFKLMVYDANPYYYLGVPTIPQIVVQLYTGIGINLYETGEIDMTGISSYDVARELDPTDPLHPDLVSGVGMCTSFVTFDVTRPPFDDVKVRQAFSMAFDRQKYIDVVDSGVGIPAKGLYPPAQPGFNPNLQGLSYDPQQARQLLAQSKYGGPQGLPPIVFTSQGIGNTAGVDVAALAQMWQQNLGVKITIENLEPDKYLDLVNSGQHGQIFSGGWCADYPDPENFADILFHTGSQQNTGNYSNPALDAVLDQARVEQDVTKRIQLYQQAEQTIVQDAPVLFISHDLSYMLVKPYVKGFVLTPIDIPIERYLKLQH